MTNVVTEEMNEIKRSLWGAYEDKFISDIGYSELCRCVDYIADPVSDVVQAMRIHPIHRAKAGYYKGEIDSRLSSWSDSQEEIRERKWNKAYKDLMDTGYSKPTKDQVQSVISGDEEYATLRDKVRKLKRLSSLVGTIYTTIDQRRSLLEQIANTERLRRRQEQEQ